MITIREGLGSFFLVAINTVGDEIYLHFLSWCNEEEQQFFDKGWDFGILEQACLLYKQLVQGLTRALQQIRVTIIVLIK